MSLTFASNLTKMIDAGLGGEVIAPDTSVAVGYRMQYNMVSGPVASWNDPEGGFPINLLTAIEPIQDLHGQDAPYPAGGGKNLMDINSITVGSATNWNVEVNGDTLSVTHKTEYSTGTPSFSFTQPSGTYVISIGSINVTGQVSLYVNGSWSKTINNGDAFTIDSANTNEIKFSAQAGQTTVITKIQIEKGTTATAYAPYSNICPISGRTEVNVWREATYDTSAEPILTLQLGQTVYGGRLNVTSGVLKVDWANIASYDGETLPGEWISDRDVYSPGATPTTGAQVCYKLAEPLTVQLSPQTINSLLGQNNIWSDAGDVSVTWKEKLYTEGY